MSNASVSAAIDRLFRTYVQFNLESGPDTLVNLLTALHSLDERVNELLGRMFFHIPEYLVLKALRNHVLHAEEVFHVVSVKSPDGMPFSTDLGIACLIGLPDCLAAMAAVRGAEHRLEAEAAFNATAKVYLGKVVDLNPCIFNGLVKVFEKLCELGLKGTGEAYLKFRLQYDWESENGHSHYVTGGVGLHAANLSRHQEWLVGQFEAAFK